MAIYLILSSAEKEELIQNVLTQVAEQFSRYRIWMHPFQGWVLFLFLVGGPFALRLSQPVGSQPSLPRRSYLPGGVLWGIL